MTKPATRAASAPRSAPAARPATSDGEPPRRRRLTAEARKSSILAAARRAFSETGDMNGTTIKLIAERSGISEAWREAEDRYGFPFESPDMSARAVMGMALILALENHHTKKFDRDRAPSRGNYLRREPAAGAGP